MSLQSRLESLKTRHAGLEARISERRPPAAAGRGRDGQAEAREAATEGGDGAAAERRRRTPDGAACRPIAVTATVPDATGSTDGSKLDAAGCAVGERSGQAASSASGIGGGPARRGPRGPAAHWPATTMAFRSVWLHRPRITGSRGLMLAVFQWLRSRTFWIVSLVVPISLPICASVSCGIVAQQEGDAIRPVVALGNRRVARAARAASAAGMRWPCSFSRSAGIGLAAMDLLQRHLAVGHRIVADDALAPPRRRRWPGPRAGACRRNRRSA